jgi:hypothetical protein
MISCQTFRSRLQAGSHEPEAMEHLRKCDLCLEFAVSVDGDNFFRAIGGNELTPPGGLDAFVGDVMNQVHMRQAEGAVGRRRLPSPWRLAVAATILIGISGAAFVYRHEVLSAPIARVETAARRTEFVTKPIVESYDSKTATIVELPGPKDTQVVMIFDESLPADL